MAVADAVEACKRGDLQALVNLLADLDQLTRCAAAQQLGDLGDPAAVKPLVRTLQASDDGLRISAAKALAKIGEPAAIRRC
jgi:HEAT repeat protein